MIRARKASIRAVIAQLRAMHGEPSAPLPDDPYEQAVRESVAYLVNDERREAAYDALRREVGVEPEALLATSPRRLAAVIREGGMHPERRAASLRECAQVALDVGRERLRALSREGSPEAVKQLRRFPGFGEPAVDRLLMASGAKVTLAPESNGLRVLVRLGACEEERAYAKTYRAACAAVEDDLPRDPRWLWRAHQLLRRHGQQVCKRTTPRCELCPLSAGCRSFGAAAR